MTMWNRRRAKCCAPPWLRTIGAYQFGRTQYYGQSRAAGFTLLEVLVAVAIVAVALVTFMGLHLRSLDATIRAQDLTAAVLLAQGKMATMGEFPDTGETQGRFEGPELERFQWATAVTERRLDVGGRSATVRRLEVTVFWVDGQQRRHYTLEAYGVQQ